ncbi:hypothetical protein JOQ06_005993, partial [Pogonophryne albipinna]
MDTGGAFRHGVMYQAAGSSQRASQGEDEESGPLATDGREANGLERLSYSEHSVLICHKHTPTDRRSRRTHRAAFFASLIYTFSPSALQAEAVLCQRSNACCLFLGVFVDMDASGGERERGFARYCQDGLQKEMFRQTATRSTDEGHELCRAKQEESKPLG